MVLPPSQEFAGAEFGDRRLSRRLDAIADQLASSPQDGLPVALETESALEGFYRFVNNDRVNPVAILAPHFEATRRRVQPRGQVLVVHDTTRLHFNGRGFGPLLGSEQGEGFFLHLALGLADPQSREPLGVLGAGTFERKKRPKGARKSKQERAEESEMNAWKLLFADVQLRLGEQRAVHVMDRQADCYDLLAGMAGNADFVVRVAHDRMVAGEDGDLKLRSALDGLRTVLVRELPISRRDKGWNLKRHHPARDEREVRLVVAARPVAILRPPNADRNSPAELNLNVVHVVETDPPQGEDPVEWILYTSLPIATASDVAAVIDTYRARWVIEEYFKALKTGCAYEKRQLESPEALLNMLAITIPIAWRLLLLRHLARNAPEKPASAALPDSQLQVLASIERARLPSSPTVRDAMLAVARLGGHIKNNGEPGWLVLTRGYTRLLTLEEGWLARDSTPQRSDQS